jgi:hypothetical protein
MAYIKVRVPRTSQPQDLVGIDLRHPLIYGGSESVCLIGGISTDAITGQPLVVSGTDMASATPNGVGHFNNASGDLSPTVSNYGGSISVTYWAGYWYGSDLTNRYLFGDYDGSSGTGLTPSHGNIGGRWGYFNGGSVTDSGETLVNGGYYVFVVTRDVASGALKVYKNGNLVITNAGVTANTSSFAVGSIGKNQTSFDTRSSTLVSGRMRYRSWTPAEVASFSANPWQIFEPEERLIWIPDAVSAGGGATVIPIGQQATGSVGSPTATGAATTAATGVSAASAVGTPTAIAGASIPATVTPAGVIAHASIGSLIATGAAWTVAGGVQAASAVGSPTAIAGTSIPATALPAGVSALSAVGTPSSHGASIAYAGGISAFSAVGAPTAIGGVSGQATALPAGVQAISYVGVPTATSAAVVYAYGVQAIGYVGMPIALGDPVAFTPSVYQAISPAQSYTVTSPAQSYTVTVQPQIYIA